MHEQLKPWEPTRDNPWDFDAAAHLWRRAGFAAPARTVKQTLALTPAAAVEKMVDGPGKEEAAEELEFVYQSVIGANDEAGARAWILMRMLRGEHQLREKIALFWHGHFATSLAKVRDLGWMTRQYRIFLELGLGKFAPLLDRVARDPAMIRWLDNETNRKGSPNENYAREVLELFTLGEGNYSEKDIQEAARAFTGWHILREQFHFSSSLHDRDEKVVLGQRGRFGGEDIQRIALEQSACARFLADKLLRFFVTPEPSAEIVTALADVLRASDYDMTATLRVLFGSRLFFAPDTRRSLIKGPIDFVVGSARALEMKKTNTKAALPLLRAMGQDLLAPPNVKGWPGQRAWINTATWLTRVRTARALAEQAKSRSIDNAALALLGRPLPGPEGKQMAGSGAGAKDLVQALLTLPEAHLA